MQYWNSSIFKSETSNIATLIPTTLISGVAIMWWFTTAQHFYKCTICCKINVKLRYKCQKQILHVSGEVPLSS